MKTTVEDKKVGNLITHEMLSVPENSKVCNVAKTLIKARIQGVVVVNENNEPVGIVSEMDILKAFSRHREENKVSEIMSPLTETIGIGENIEAAKKTMSNKGIHRLVVVDKNNKMRGILCAGDIMIKAHSN